jgi:ketosteroid isomerase-like protein
MEPEETVKAYFEALNSGSYERIIRLFSKYALVDSPLYGKMQASEFFKDLLADTAKSKVTVTDILESKKFGSIAARISYQWILKNSKFTSFEGVDLFQVSPEGKIDRLSIFYDTANVRDAWKKSMK